MRQMKHLVWHEMSHNKRSNKSILVALTRLNMSLFMPIELIPQLVALCCFIQTPPWSVPWHNAVEHTLAAATVNASQKYGKTQTVECLKAFSKPSQFQGFTFESARISLKWTFVILLTMVTQRYRPLFSQTDRLLIWWFFVGSTQSVPIS